MTRLRDALHTKRVNMEPIRLPDPPPGPTQGVFSDPDFHPKRQENGEAHNADENQPDEETTRSKFAES